MRKNIARVLSQFSDEHVVADVLAAEEVERAQVGAVPREGVQRLRVQEIALGEDLGHVARYVMRRCTTLHFSKPLPEYLTKHWIWMHFKNIHEKSHASNVIPSQFGDVTAVVTEVVHLKEQGE